MRGAPPRQPIVTVSLLLLVATAALVGGRVRGIVAAVVSLTVFDYFFIGTPNKLEVPTVEEWVFFIGQLAVALVVGSLADRVLAAKRHVRELDASDRLQRTLLSAVSHDLKTPLTTILGSLNSLLFEEGILGETGRRELLRLAYEQAKRLERLVNGVLDMTRLEAGAVRLRLEPASVTELVQAALARLDNALSEQRYRILVPPELPSVPVDAVLLSTALANILDNAAKFSPPDTMVDIDAGAKDGHVFISVADSRRRHARG
jgi:two-component system, OmpR family, sensor histidine kinase KdpD